MTQITPPAADERELALFLRDCIEQYDAGTLEAWKVDIANQVHPTWSGLQARVDVGLVPKQFLAMDVKEIASFALWLGQDAAGVPARGAALAALRPAIERSQSDAHAAQRAFCEETAPNRVLWEAVQSAEAHLDSLQELEDELTAC